MTAIPWLLAVILRPVMRVGVGLVKAKAARTPRAHWKRCALGGHSDSAICCCNQTLKRKKTSQVHMCALLPPSYDLPLKKKKRGKPQKPQNTFYFEVSTYSVHAHTHGLQAQIAGSSLHAAQSTAAGTNQHNPPADRYGSLTATHTRRNLPEHSNARTRTRAINRSCNAHSLKEGMCVCAGVRV